MARSFWLSCALLTSLLLAPGCGGGADQSAPAEERTSASGSAGAATAEATTTATAADAKPEVALQTNFGVIKLRLHRDKAPETVANFLDYVANGHYNETIFHHVESGFLAIAGGYTPSLDEKPSRYPVFNESANGLKNKRGTIAMTWVPDSTDSHPCQFFINLADNPHLDAGGDNPAGFCVFGEVIEGFDVLDKLAQVEVRAAENFEKLPVETVLIETARRIR